MVFVLIAAAVVAVLAAVVFLRLRPRGGDLDSVRSYHSALGTLEHLSDRTGPSPVRVVGPAGQEPGPRIYPPPEGRAAGTVEVPPVPVRGSDEFPEPGTPLVFDDARPAGRPRVQRPAEGAGPLRVDRAQRHALDSMNHRPRRATAVVVAVIVLAVFAVLAYTGSKRTRSTGHSASTSSSTPTTGTARAATSTSLSSSATHTTHTTSAGGHTKKGKVATTTTTAPSQILAASTTGSAATYPVGPSSYRVSVTATAPCWVLATSASTGTTLWTGTLQAGGSQVIHATGAVTVELGAPSVHLTVNQVPVVFPTPMHTPFQATFQPATPAAPAAGTTTTTTAPVATP